MEEKSADGSVWARGVVGRLEVLLSSDELLSWRASELVSPMLSVSSGALSIGAGRWSGLRAATSIARSPAGCAVDGLRAGVGPGGEGAVVMALRRWMRSSCRSSSFAEGGRGALGLMAASWVNT